MSARVEDGWLVVDCDAADAAPVHIGISKSDLQPAFRDYAANGKRVAKIRLPQGKTSRVRVYLKVGDQLDDVGLVTLR